MILLFFILMFSSVEAESLRVRFIDGKKTIRLSGYNIRFNGAVGRPGFNLNRYEITQNLVQR